MKYESLAIQNEKELLYGVAPKPLTTRMGLTIGGGLVYPELNFTLPAMDIIEKNMPAICRHYQDIVTDALTRAAELDAAGVVLEFETLPPMTEFPDIGLKLLDILMEGMDKAKDKYGLNSAIRMTPNDNREFVRPPQMRSGRYYEAMVKLFEESAARGADMLSIESVGGKELHDDALVNGDLRMMLFALCTLGVRDMEFVWDMICSVADKHEGVVAAGDTACGFGNTAMVLAEKKMIPRVFSSVVRAVTAVRSLVAYECGAVGPGKDCGYENPIMKAITGYPMSMEGKTAACAHWSPMGNLAAATADLWSNESVQNIKLLGGMAPTCYMEQLIYDCRLMNIAIQDGPTAHAQMKDWLVRSDLALDPQAFIISPANSIELGKAIVAEKNHYDAGRAVAAKAIELMEEAHGAGQLKIDQKEIRWLGMMSDLLDDMPDTEDEFIEEMLEEVDTSKIRLEDYGINA